MSILALRIKQANHTALHLIYCHLRLVSLSLFHKWHDFRKKKFQHKMCGLIFSTTFPLIISHSKKNSARYKILNSTAYYTLNIIFPHLHTPQPPHHIQLLHNNFYGCSNYINAPTYHVKGQDLDLKLPKPVNKPDDDL